MNCTLILCRSFLPARILRSITDLAAGEAQQVDALLSLQDVGDGEYPLSAVLQDSAGNRSLDSLLVALDSAPPQNAVASSPEQSVTGKFTISWAGEGAGADQGSGLSGEYDLRMRIGSGQWFEVLNREKTSSYTYVGTHGNRFFFEVAAWDNVGNREPFTGEPETSTLVDTAFVDQTARFSGNLEKSCRSERDIHRFLQTRITAAIG